MTKPGLILLTLPSLLAACGGTDGPAPAEVRARLAGDLGHVLREAEAASAQGSAMLDASAALGFLDRFVAVPGLTSTPALAKVLRAPADPEPASDQLIDQLTSTLFTDANHVGDGIFRIPADLACTTEIVDDAGDASEVLDEACVEQWDQVQPRIRTAIDDDVLVLALQVGANHDEPMALAITHTSLALTLDLDEAGQAIAALAPLFDQPPHASLHGALTGELEVLGAAHVRASLSIDRPLAIAFAEPGIALEGDQAFRLTSTPSRLLEADLDASTGEARLTVDLGETHVHSPGEPATDGTDLDLPGIHATATLCPDAPLALSDVSLGNRTTTLTVDGRQALAIDLNRETGLPVAATITHDDATGATTLAVDRLDLELAVDHAALGDEAPVYDVTRVRMTGGVRGSETSELLEVLGTLAIETDPAAFGISAAAGQCVLSTETVDAATGQLYDALRVGTCF